MGYRCGFMAEQCKQELAYVGMKSSGFPLIPVISLLNRNSGS